jgi:hypothetical protein
MDDAPGRRFIGIRSVSLDNLDEHVRSNGGNPRVPNRTRGV